MVQKIHEDFSDRVQFVTGSLTHYEINTGDTAITDAKAALESAIVVEENAKILSDSSTSKSNYDSAIAEEKVKKQLTAGKLKNSDEWIDFQEAVEETKNALNLYLTSSEYVAWKNSVTETKNAMEFYKKEANDRGRRLVDIISNRATVVILGTFTYDTVLETDLIHIAVENNSGWNTGTYPYTDGVDPEFNENDRTTYLQDMLGGTWIVSAWEY